MGINFRRHLLRLLGAFGAVTFLISLAGASYVLSLGSFSPSDAEVLHQQLAAKGYPVYLLYGENYEVRVGGYDSREKAETVAEQLKSDEKIVARVQEEEDLDQYQPAPEGAESDDPGRDIDPEATQYYGDSRAQKIVTLALNLFGHPYKYGGTRIGKGIDCSFFTQTIFKELGIVLPRTSGEQFKIGAEVQKAALQVGDLLFFKKTYYFKKRKGTARSLTRINHVAIYIGNGEFVHATLNGKHVTISRLDEPYYTKRFAGARRVLKE